MFEVPGYRACIHALVIHCQSAIAVALFIVHSHIQHRVLKVENDRTERPENGLECKHSSECFSSFSHGFVFEW